MSVARLRVLALAASLSAGCGSSESTTSFSSCDTDQDCNGGMCSLTTICQIDECTEEIDYEFEGEEYKLVCQEGETFEETVYPLAGGPGTRTYAEDIDKCKYEYEVDFGSYSQSGKCTEIVECTRDTLSCAPSEPGDPSCSTVSTRTCG